ncbi:unnamed protein product [Brachionus calyciflorus]|uniref:CDP-diacylglycerol--inositol 3-phosphatidyltransferase n=1 Tax=Brachionus calyciflorus TaxID=104777 RepID=A0A813NBC3_9BILA|nr:unnamed protein product [Brachionus calyciflorus]
MNEKLAILLYIPNVIDYFRLILIVVAWLNIEKSTIFLTLYLSQAVLDFFDGYFAKKLNQVSSLGAWLDVVLDNLGRGILWTHVSKYGLIISVIEWLAFSCTQKNGSRWKETFSQAPFLVRNVFKNNFKTPLGLTTISAGLQGLPVWLYIYINFNTQVTGYIATLFHGILVYCAFGRLICLLVELWVIFKNLEFLIDDDLKEKKTQ